MVKSYKFLACLLLILLPLQVVAAINLSVCNSLMKSEVIQTSVVASTCHDDMSNTTELETVFDHKNSSKQNCDSLCLAMGSMAVFPSSLKDLVVFDSSPILGFIDLSYNSITQPSLQRPPISIF